MKEGAPVRFLVLLLIGWTGLRATTLSLDWWDAPPVDAPRPPVPPAPVRARDPVTAAMTVDAQRSIATPVEPAPVERPRGLPHRAAAAVASPDAEPARPPSPLESRPAHPVPQIPAPVALPAPPFALPRSIPAATQRPARRSSGSAWLLARQEGGAALAPGGTLGGSQAGARLLYRLNRDAARPLAISGRVYVPLRRAAGAEAALGLDWRPSARLTIHFLVERRQRLGAEGRSAFAAALYGGGSTGLGRGWRLDGYGQAGIVGARARDLFVDGALRVSRRIGPVEAGGALWGAAQPGVARLDAGPLLTLPIRARDTTLRLSAEYRFRIAGDARPPSGPALTLGVDF